GPVRWCNGSTRPFGGLCPGSNPGRTASFHEKAPMNPNPAIPPTPTRSGPTACRAGKPSAPAIGTGMGEPTSWWQMQARNCTCSVWMAPPAIQHQLTEVSDKAIQKALEKQHLSKEQAEAAREAGAKWAGLGTKIMAVAGPVLAGILIPVWWGLLVWLLGTKALKAQFPFLKGIEVAGLANMINVLGAVVKSLLILVTGNAFAT